MGKGKTGRRRGGREEDIDQGSARARPDTVSDFINDRGETNERPNTDVVPPVRRETIRVIFEKSGPLKLFPLGFSVNQLGDSE